MKFFWDTYAFVELVEGNEKFLKYMESEPITSVLNIYELVFALLRDGKVQQAPFCAAKYWPMIVEPDKESLIGASEFKLAHKKLMFSYADALGYILAKIHGAKFLTGDRQFRGMPNVEFVR